MTTAISYSNYLNLSASFRVYFENYCINKNYDSDFKIGLKILNSIDKLAEIDETFRQKIVYWLQKKNGYSTIELRKLCDQVGFDYWEHLSIANAIDAIDTCQAKYNYLHPDESKSSTKPMRLQKKRNNVWYNVRNLNTNKCSITELVFKLHALRERNKNTSYQIV